MMQNDIQPAIDLIRQKINDRSPDMAIMLGSGLGALADTATDRIEISYSDIPGFPVPTVAGHDGKMIFGKLDGKDILFLKGRVHAYETDDFTPFKNLIYTVKQLGIQTLFTTSASGSLHDNMPPGSIMLISDHINMMGTNPLLGPNADDIGPRFPDMGDAWSLQTRKRILRLATDLKIDLHEGVYFALRGPCFETPAEIRMARLLGGDAVGMSAVPENIIANHCGLTVAGCAVITNFAAGMKSETLSHDHTLAGAQLAADNLSRLLHAFISQ